MSDDNSTGVIGIKDQDIDPITLNNTKAYDDAIQVHFRIFIGSVGET